MAKKKKFTSKTIHLNLRSELEIKEQPWENYQKDTPKRYRCFCHGLKKLRDEEKRKVKLKKLNRRGLTSGKPLPYQDKLKYKLLDTSTSKKAIKRVKLLDENFNGQFLKTFQIQYKLPLSLTARSILTSFTNKYIYYAIDDILYLLESNPTERDSLLSIFYSSMLSLHTDFSINFFNIWIKSVYLNDIPKQNRFLKSQSNVSNQITETLITLKLHYFTGTPTQKPEPIW